jgi:hypothetical protein
MYDSLLVAWFGRPVSSCPTTVRSSSVRGEVPGGGDHHGRECGGRREGRDRSWAGNVHGVCSDFGGTTLRRAGWLSLQG